MRGFASTWNNLLNHCISANFLLIVVLVKIALRKEMLIAPFVERFNTPLWESLTETFCQYLEKITCIFVVFLRIVALVQSALRKELFIAPLVEHFKMAALEKSGWEILLAPLPIYLKHCISTDFLLTWALVQSALQKELSIVPFVERINTATLGKS